MEQDGAQNFYTVYCPNLEVRQSLNQKLLSYLGRQSKEVSDYGKEHGRLLAANNFDGFADRLKSFLAGIHYQWQIGKGPAPYEAWYTGMLYVCFRTIGLDFRVEDSLNMARADIVVFHCGQVFLFELKVADGEGDKDSTVQKAIKQMCDRGYADKYQDRGEQPTS